MMTLSDIFKSPRFFFVVIAVLSTLALAGAFMAEYVFGLEPCTLCLYQRWPFVFAIGLCMLGRGGRTSANFMSSACALLFLTFSANSALAFYHSGVERKWWVSFLEGCSVPDFSDTSQSFLDSIMSAPSVPCDQIPWADPVFGLSMANYNVAFCAVLALSCLIALFTLRKT